MHVGMLGICLVIVSSVRVRYRYRWAWGIDSLAKTFVSLLLLSFGSFGMIGKEAMILGAISLIIFHGFLDVDSISFSKGYLWSLGMVALESPSLIPRLA